MALITLATAKAHLRIDSTDARDEDIRRKMTLAEAIVLDYLKVVETSPPLWSTEADVPPVVLAAMLYQLGELERFRGDDQAGDGPVREQYGSLSPVAEGLLRRMRDPALA